MPITEPKKNDLMTAGIKSMNSSALKAREKYNTTLTSPLRLTPSQLPNNPAVSANNTSSGIMNVAASTRVTTKYFIGLVADTSMASICSVTFMEPSSAPIPEPIFPAQMSAVITGPISRMSDTDTICGSMDSAPKSLNTGRDWMVNTNPMMAPVNATRANDLLPTMKHWRRNSLNSSGSENASLITCPMNTVMLPTCDRKLLASFVFCMVFSLRRMERSVAKFFTLTIGVNFFMSGFVLLCI